MSDLHPPYQPCRLEHHHIPCRRGITIPQTHLTPSVPHLPSRLSGRGRPADGGKQISVRGDEDETFMTAYAGRKESPTNTKNPSPVTMYKCKITT